MDQSAMCCISMDLSRRDVQTNGKLFFKFRNDFLNNYTFLNNSGVGFMHARWRRHLC